MKRNEAAILKRATAAMQAARQKVAKQVAYAKIGAMNQQQLAQTLAALEAMQVEDEINLNPPSQLNA